MSISAKSNRNGIEKRIRVGKRLLTAAEYVAVSSAVGVNGEKVCADIGCDHGYLSIHLIEKGICDKVYACDVNEKPINTARKNILARDCGDGRLSQKIELRLTDGLSGLDDSRINHIIICGMGGELIAQIIDKGSTFKKNGVKFILQPMSGEMELREWLCDNGFEIEDETLLRDCGRIYTVMCVVYTGEKSSMTPSELMLGKHNIEKGTELLCELCERKLVHAKNLLKQPEYTEKDKLLEKELSAILESFER